MKTIPRFPHTVLKELPSSYGPARSATDNLTQKRYVAAGDHAYVIGMLDGSFPPIGTRIRGEMGGVWAPPIKLLTGYWFALNGEWLPAATCTFLEFLRSMFYYRTRISKTTTTTAAPTIIKVF